MSYILEQENLIYSFANNEVTNSQPDLEDKDITDNFLSEHWRGTLEQGTKSPNACIGSCDQQVTALGMYQYPAFAHTQMG